MQAAATSWCPSCRRTWPGAPHLCLLDGSQTLQLPSAREGRAVSAAPPPAPPSTSLWAAARSTRPPNWLKGPWRELLGPMPRGSIVIYGPPGSRKTTAALSFAAMAAAGGARVALADAEMAGPAVASLLRAARVRRSEAERITRQRVEAVVHIDELLEQDPPDVLVVDSLTAVRAEAPDARRWSTKAPWTLYVAQVTSSGTSRGGPGFLHDCDVVAEGKAGVLTAVKNRFAPSVSVDVEELLGGHLEPSLADATNVTLLHPGVV